MVGRKANSFSKMMPYSNCCKYYRNEYFSKKSGRSNGLPTGQGAKNAGPFSGTEGHAHEKWYIWGTIVNTVNLIESRLNKEKLLGIWVRDHLD